MLVGILFLSCSFACVIYSWNGSISSPGLLAPWGLVLMPYAVMFACMGIGAVFGRWLAGWLIGIAILMLFTVAACVYLFIQ